MKPGRLHFLLKSKGRHGTHSPFAYAFVERVLRKKVLGLPPPPPGKKKNEWAILLKAIDFLAPDRIVLAVNPSSGWEEVLGERFGQAKLSLLDESRSYSGEKVFLILDDLASRDVKGILQQFAKQCQCLTIYILQIRANIHVFMSWSALVEMPEVGTSIDIWHSGILVVDDSFKRKQHFLLR